MTKSFLMSIKEYDPDADILYVEFEENPSGTGIPLTDNIILFVNVEQRRVESLILIDFSKIIREGEQRILRRLGGIEQLKPDLRNLVLKLLSEPPLSEFFYLAPGASESYLKRPSLKEVSQAVRRAVKVP